MSVLSQALNNAASTLAVNHAVGGGTLVLKAGEGSRFGTPTVDAPIRVTVARKSTLVGGLIAADSAYTIFLCTGRTGDTLSGLTAVEGTSDQAFFKGDPAACLITAGTISDLQDTASAAATDPDVVRTTSNYSNPAWLTGLAGSKVSGDIPGNAASITGAVAQTQVTGLAASLGLRAVGRRLVLPRTENATNAQSDGTETSASYQQSFLVPYDCFAIQLRFTNFGAAGAIPSDSYTIVNCYWDCAAVGGGRQRITFGSQHSATILPGGFVVSDPIAVVIPAGSTITFYQYVTVTAGGKWPLNFPGQGGNFSGGGTDGSNGSENGGNGSDITTTALAPEYHSWMFGPVAIYGRYTGTQPPVVGAAGDSIFAGYWDTDQKGAFFRAMMGAIPPIPFMRCGMPGQTADGFRSPAVYGPFLAAAMDAGITDFVCEFGVNDVQNGYTLAQIQANLQKIWALGTALGARVWQTTITPKTTSTDGFATTANQTRAAGFELGGVCDQLNDWIRTKPAPLSGYFDVRLAAESSPGSGLWKAPGHTTDGIHPTPTGAAAHAVAYTTSSFTFP